MPLYEISKNSIKELRSSAFLYKKIKNNFEKSISKKIWKIKWKKWKIKFQILKKTIINLNLGQFKFKI